MVSANVLYLMKMWNKKKVMKELEEEGDQGEDNQLNKKIIICWN